MNDLPLFTCKKEFFFMCAVVLFIACCSLGYEWYQFRQFIKEPIYTSKATVLNHYSKTNEKGRRYDVFKLKLDGVSPEIYTTSWRVSSIPLKARVLVKLKSDKVDFYGYLKGFYASSVALYTIYEDDPPFDVTPLYRWIDKQHDHEKMAELYKTLLFATPISKELREDVQKWGISHLIAISGYNVGVISTLLFFLLKPLYQIFQSRFFPYRNANGDIMIIVLSVLFMYMVVIDFVPSFLRAFTMSLLGFFFYSRGIKVVSFEMLGLVVGLLLALFPTLCFSLSFWFSVAGVFYLFLWMHHFSYVNKWLLLLMVDLGVFFLMIPIVHTFFPTFTFLQLSTPVSSLVFIVFYPLGVVLHVLNLGSLLDPWVLRFLAVETSSYQLTFPVWMVIGYIGCSLLAIRFKYALLMCLLFSFLSLFFIQ